METKRILCPQCEKPFRTESGLAWHLEHQHGKVTEDKGKSNGQNSPEVPANQASGALLKEPEQKSTPATMSDLERLLRGEPEHKGDFGEAVAEIKEGTAETELGKLHDEFAGLSTKADVEKLSETVSGLSSLETELSDELPALAARVVDVERAINSIKSCSEDFLKFQKSVYDRLARLHICPDCGRSLHMHLLGEGSWHLECVHCGYCTIGYKAPKWKEEHGKLFARG
jgi:ribosomal protein L37AE/L43A